MFDAQFFDSWLSILVGATGFALLFTIVGVMSDLVFEGVIRLSNRSIGLFSIAFSGYLCIAMVIRHQNQSS